MASNVIEEKPAVDKVAQPKYPGTRAAVDGSSAVVATETAASDAAGAYPITPSTQMGEGWAVAYAEGKRNVNGRRLLFFEPEGEHAAAAVTAGMSMTGLRATNFSSGQGIVYMHESLYPAVGKRLTYVLNVAARAITKHALNVHAGHDDYHAIDDTGFFQLFAKDVQESADLNLIAHRIAELSLNPGICAQDGFLTSHVIESVLLPEPELIREYLGDPADAIDSPTPAQRLVFGEKRRRIPEMFDVDYPSMLGVVQNQESYAQGVAAQRPFYFDHLPELADRAFDEFARLTGRRYARATGYRLEDAEYVIAGQGSVVANAEAVCDWLRAKGMRVGVLNLTMFRPFPTDLVSKLLAGKRGVAVLERTDQPLAVDLPLLREIRAAMGKALENGRVAAERNDRKATQRSLGVILSEAKDHLARLVHDDSSSVGKEDPTLPYPALPAVTADQIPDFYSGCFGLGSRDLQPGDIVAAVENMLPGSKRRRQFYLGIDFIRKGTQLPKLQVWQEKLLDAYPELGELSLQSSGDVNLMPPNSLSLRIHSVGGWGAITMGKNLALTAFELFGLHVKANPKYGSEKKGQPTTFYATLSHEPVRLNCELRHVDVVLSPDPNVFRNSDPLAGLADGGVFIIQSDTTPQNFFASLPQSAQRAIRERNIRVFTLDAFKIASEEASDAELRYRMQGAAFLGAFFAASPLLQREGIDRARLFEGIRAQFEAKFGKRGANVVEDNLRVIRRGFDELKEVNWSADAIVGKPEAGSPSIQIGDADAPRIPSALNTPNVQQGVGDPGRFWEQVCVPYKLGEDVIADPFAAISAMPAASSAIRDMTNVRFEVPEFIPEKCTGCAQCWTQCPDSAIPGLVTTVEDLIDRAVAHSANGKPLDRMRQVSKNLAREAHKQIKAAPMKSFGDVLTTAYRATVEKLNWDAEKRAALDGEFARVYSTLAEFPLAKTRPFFDTAESREKGSGALLSITVNPDACKGCNICVAACHDGALVTARQDDDIVERYRRNWKFWQRLPDTADRYLHIADLEEGIGTLSSLLLKKDNYLSMTGGDGACMGCGEKTSVHLVVATIEALMQSRVKKQVAKLDTLIETLDEKARTLIASDAKLDASLTVRSASSIAIPLSVEKQQHVDRITKMLGELRELRWLYTEGPGGRGRSALAITNSTGCSSVWASTYPYNPYPFPWANHLFQDSTSLAIGVFEGHMRKMADGFTVVRRAELEAAGKYTPDAEQELGALDWKSFTDEEMDLCPPIVAIGGDGAMLDIGFQNLSRLMSSGKPIRVVVLDTQVYSNTGGQACTSGYTGQISDMAAWGKALRGKQEERKELSLIAIAHRGAFVHQSSQASATHLMAGVIKAMRSKRPAVINIYTPCPVEHGLADDWAPRAARLALESRAFPFLTYDPDAGSSVADCLSLQGNPALDAQWPQYKLEYINENGQASSMKLPLTTADWAATEGRFRKHFKPITADDDALMRFDEFLLLSSDERRDKKPFIFAVDRDRRLSRLSVSEEMVHLAEERQRFWYQLRELAGVEVPASVRDRITSELEAELNARLAALTAEYEAKIHQLQMEYPAAIARKMAEGLMKSVGEKAFAALLDGFAPSGSRTPSPASVSSRQSEAQMSSRQSEAQMSSRQSEATRDPLHLSSNAQAQGDFSSQKALVEMTAAAKPLVEMTGPELDDEPIGADPYIETARCTSCNECTNLNSRLFGYDENKQAFVKDPKAGTFAELVTAAERCPVSAIHPGMPLNPKEKDLDKWTARAQRFN